MNPRHGNKTKNHTDFFNEVVNGTISIGISTLIGNDEQKISTNKLTHQADDAQYLAKHSGRNMVGVHENGEMHIYDRHEQLVRLKAKLLNTLHELKVEKKKFDTKVKILKVLAKAGDSDMTELTNNESEAIENKIIELQSKVDTLNIKISEIDIPTETIEKELVAEESAV